MTSRSIKVHLGRHFGIFQCEEIEDAALDADRIIVVCTTKGGGVLAVTVISGESLSPSAFIVRYAG